LKETIAVLSFINFSPMKTTGKFFIMLILLLSACSKKDIEYDTSAAGTIGLISSPCSIN